MPPTKEVEMQSTPAYWSNLQRLCAIIEPRLFKAFSEALENFNKIHGPLMYLYYTREMAGNMHAHIRERVRAHFDSLPWAHIIEKPKGTFMLLVDGHMLGIPVIVGIKFKKQDKRLRTANIQTGAVISFDSHQMEYLKYVPEIQESLFPDMKGKVANPPKGNNLIAAYTPDATWSEYVKLSVNFPLGGRKSKLVSEFTHLELGAVADIIEMPSKEQPKRTGRVRRRSDAKQPARTKLRKFIATPEAVNQEEIRHRKKKGNDGQGS
jgi:hypothetical protein